jgi:hypothetical protein
MPVSSPPRSPRDASPGSTRRGAARVNGVIDVLTREAAADGGHRPRLQGRRGSFLKVRRSDRFMTLTSIQRTAGRDCRVAEGWRSRASRVAGSRGYEEQAHVTDLYRQRGEAVPVKPQQTRSGIHASKAARCGRDGIRCSAVRHQGECYVPIRASQPIELYLDGDVWDSGSKLTVHDKTQGVRTCSVTSAACST